MVRPSASRLVRNGDIEGEMSQYIFITGKLSEKKERLSCGFSVNIGKKVRKKSGVTDNRNFLVLQTFCKIQYN